MSVCSSIAGSGLGGAIGNAAKALGGALGVAVGADAASRAITGYGLIDTLNVPYLECDDGHFATAIEWWSNGMKCGPKPPSPDDFKPGGNSYSPGKGNPQGSPSINALKDYKNSLPLGSTVQVAVGIWSVFRIFGPNSFEIITPKAGGRGPGPTRNYRNPDSGGNSIKLNAQAASGVGAWFGTEEGGNGYGWEYLQKDSLDPDPSLPSGPYDRANISNVVCGADDAGFDRAMTLLGQGYGIIGVYVKTPDNSSFPKFNAPGSPPQPSEPDRNEDCNEMGCPCLSKSDLTNAVKDALGLNKPLIPEQMINLIGKQIFAGVQAQSTFSTTPATLIDAIAALVAVVYFRAGMHRFPAVMPGSLLDDGSKNIKVEKIEEWGQWFEWFIKQFDSLMGEFPIDIQIKDKNGSKPMKFENLAECLSELTGLIVQTAVDADTGVNMGSHAVVEASKAGNAAIIAQRNAKVLIDFFGIRTDGDVIEVKSTITPGKIDELNNAQDGHGVAEFLQPSVQYLQVLKEVDPFDVQAVLQRILQNSEMARQAVYHEVNENKGKNDMTGDYIRRQKAYDKQEPPEKLRAYKKAIKDKINNDPNSPIKIEIDRVPDVLPDVVGDNFVIRRPKTET